MRWIAAAPWLFSSTPAASAGEEKPRHIPLGILFSG